MLIIFKNREIFLIEELRIPSLLTSIYQSKLPADYDQTIPSEITEGRRTVSFFQVGKFHFLLKIINNILLRE